MQPACPWRKHRAPGTWKTTFNPHIIHRCMEKAKHKAFQLYQHLHGLTEKFSTAKNTFFHGLQHMAYVGDPVRQLVLDTGASYHIASYGTLTKKEWSTVKKLPNPIVLQTANKTVTITEQATIKVKELGIQVDCLLLADSPSVLSVGRLCKENNCTFQWDGNAPPTIHLKDSTTGSSKRSVVCGVQHNCPVCVTGTAVPAPLASEDPGGGWEGLSPSPTQPDEAQSEAHPDSQPQPTQEKSEGPESPDVAIREEQELSLIHI